MPHEQAKVEVAVADVPDERRHEEAVARSRLVSRMHSARREIGTQASVAYSPHPGVLRNPTGMFPAELSGGVGLTVGFKVVLARTDRAIAIRLLPA